MMNIQKYGFLEKLILDMTVRIGVLESYRGVYWAFHTLLHAMGSYEWGEFEKRS